MVHSKAVVGITARSGRASRRVGLLAVGVLALLKATAFVPASRSVASTAQRGRELLRGNTVARRAEGEGEGEEDGFLKFLKVEQDIDLSPEEYQMALDAEVEDLRKRLYINGQVKPGNLIVPWKGVNEEELLKEARKKLRKNGIKDPSGADVADDEKDSDITLQLVGNQDVVVNWQGGQPGQKVGYIVERKPTSESNFVEIASYEAQQFQYLLVKPYAGHDYEFSDQLVDPGSYTYRILVRFRTGEVNVVDTKEIIVPEPEGVEDVAGLVGVALFFVVATVGGYLLDPPVE